MTTMLACLSSDTYRCGDPACEACLRVDPADGWCYFVKLPDGLIKIGSTLSLKTRVKELRGELLLALRGYQQAEREAHDLFAHLRVPGTGERFEAAPELLSFIKEAA